MSEHETHDSAPETVAAPTRPAVASRRARRGSAGRRAVTRYTLDLENQQHMFLRLFSLQNDVEASKVCRTLLYLLESDPEVQNRVLNELFADDPEDPQG